jgi:hypothetical protein
MHRASLTSSAQLESETEAPAEQHNPHQTRRNRDVRQPSQTTSSAWTPVEHSNSNLKRKRETLQGTDVWKPYVSPYRPIGPSPRDTPTISRSPNSFAPANAAREELPLLNYIYRKDAPINGTSQLQDTTRVSSPASSRPSVDKPWGSAAQNSSRTAISSEHANHSVRRDASASMSPSDQLLDQQHIRPEPQHSKHADKSTGSRPSSRETALIDSLPRRKQTQIYDIIDGLQSGITSCMKQAESMQKQLDTLQMALGIEVDSNSGARIS